MVLLFKIPQKLTKPNLVEKKAENGGKTVKWLAHLGKLF